MKRMLITLCFLFLLTTSMYAQRDLKTYPVFQGEVVPGKRRAGGESGITR